MGARVSAVRSILKRHLGIISLVTVTLINVSCLSYESAKLLTSKPFRAGLTHIAGDYRFTNQNYLIEGAEKMRELGARSIFLYLTPDFRKSYRDGTSGETWPNENPKTLADLIETAPFKKVLAMPFETIVFTTYSFSVGDCVIQCGDSQGKAKLEENEFYELTKHLLSKYQNTGKVFILKHWEGDWIALRNYDTTKDVEPARAQDMITWLKARQAGIERARKELSKLKGVAVFHAVEVNRVLDYSDRGMKRVIDQVVPYVNADMVSYSSYDAMIGPEAQDKPSTKRVLKEALTAMDHLAPDPLGLGKKRIFISEFGLYENDRPADEATWRTEAVLEASSEFGLSFAFFWELFDNECKDSQGQDLGERNALGPDDPARPTNGTCRGLWVVRPDGTQSEALKALQPLF